MNSPETITIDLTATLFQEPEWASLLDDIRHAADRHRFRLGVQLHNTSYEEDIAKAVATGLPLTAHLPLLSQWQINLAAAEPGPSLEALHDSVTLMRRYGISRGVVHGFVMTDTPIPSFGRGRSYDEGMSRIHRPELSLPGSRICRDFLGTPEFAERRERVKKRLAWMRTEYPDVEILIENDFPSYGAGNLFADCALQLDHGLCFDSSHLWAAAHVFDRDYYHEVRAFMDTGKVKMVHLHASDCMPGVPKTAWTDGHKPLTINTPMDLTKLVGICRAGGVTHYVFEIRGISAADIEKFAELRHAAGPSAGEQ